MLVQDNARPHTAKHTHATLLQNNIFVVPDWPANSADLNPIENIWSILHTEVSKDNPTTLEELCNSK